MRQVNEPKDREPVLGPAIKPAPAPAPDPVRSFEQQTDRPLIGDAHRALESIAETIRKQITPVSPGKAEEWEGLCLDEYTLTILSCI